MKTKILAVLAIVAVISVLMSSAAYNQFTAERDASIDVVNDQNGILAIQPGPSSFVQLTNGELEIDVTNGGADGVNVNSTLMIGNSSSPTSTPAFSVTNNDQEAHDITFEYTDVAADSSADSNVVFNVYDSSGTLVDSFSENGASTISGASSGSTYYVTTEVDTTSLTTSDDLSGTLRLTSE